MDCNGDTQLKTYVSAITLELKPSTKAPQTPESKLNGTENKTSTSPALKENKADVETCNGQYNFLKAGHEILYDYHSLFSEIFIYPPPFLLWVIFIMVSYNDVNWGLRKFITPNVH